MEFLRPLPCLVIPLAEVHHDLPYIRFSPRNELRVPPPEATVEIPHGTPGLLRHLRGDGSTLCNCLAGSNVHTRNLTRRNLPLKHPLPPVASVVVKSPRCPCPPSFSASFGQDPSRSPRGHGRHPRARWLAEALPPEDPGPAPKPYEPICWEACKPIQLPFDDG